MPHSPSLTVPGLLRGARLLLPILPGLVAYGLIFGAAAAHRGVTLGEAVAMSAFVYAGASQMVALEIWRDSWSLAALFTVFLVTAAVNARFTLMSAAMQPWLAGAPPHRVAWWMFFLVDANWILATRDREEGGRDLGVFLGAGLLSWAFWVLVTIPGHLLGSLVTEPRRYGLDLVMPVFFGAMAVGLWRGWAVSALPWLVAAATALLVQALVPGYLFIVAGALAGAATGGLSRDPR